MHSWRDKLRNLFVRAAKHLTPKPDPSGTIRDLSEALRTASDEIRTLSSPARRRYEENMERAAELIEARQMAGAGPWLVAEARTRVNDPKARLRESDALVSQGGLADLELALNNLEWRREINLSWLEFSRWGIQQIILISRLYYLKNPLIRRGVDISSVYVFGRGVEVSSPDEDANGVLQEFFTRNKKTLGQNALTELEKRTWYDGNIFFVLFADQNSSGQVSVRTIDATEIFDIVTDPDDTDAPWYYRRTWTQRIFNPQTGAMSETTRDMWYPAINYEPEPGEKVDVINGIPVAWDSPVLHFRVGALSKWHYGVPPVYPALDWAKAARKFLEDCATVKRALAQFAMTAETKGGQAAIEGMKQQLQTTVGLNTSAWDTNPPAGSGSTFISGPGTKIAAFQSKGAGGDPDEVRQYKLMVSMCFGVPESFFSDMNTSNLATATSLDRPTQLAFMSKQESWREVLVMIARYVLTASLRAPSGQLREALGKRDRGKDSFRHVSFDDRRTSMGPRSHESISILESRRKRKSDGTWIYEATSDPDSQIEVRVDFPAILESDVPERVKAIVQAMTLGNAQGSIVGIDEKAGVGLLYKEIGVENSEELLEDQYPEGEYDPDRTEEEPPAPIPGVPVNPMPPRPGQQPPAAAKPGEVKEAIRRLGRAIERYSERADAAD